MVQRRYWMKYYLISRAIIDWRGRMIIVSEPYNCHPSTIFVRDGSSILHVLPLTKEQYVKCVASVKARQKQSVDTKCGSMVGAVIGIVILILWFYQPPLF